MRSLVCAIRCAREVDLATNLELDAALIEEARQLGGHTSERATVEAALREYVDRRKRLAVRAIFGTIDWPDDDDDKAERERSP